MTASKQLANRFREILLDGDWVVSTNYKVQLTDLTWQQATTKIGSFNTIAALTFHINYYIAGILNVLTGGSLDIKDKYSFDFKPIESKEDWQKLLDKMWDDAEKFAILLEQIPDNKLDEDFADKKYGSYLQNINAMIEHSYYHLGQITLIKKMLLNSEK